MPEKLKIKISMPDDDDRIRQLKKLTLKEAIRLIQGKEYSDAVKSDLIARLKLQPVNTYENFLKNIHMHLKKIQNKKNLLRTQLEDERVDENQSSDPNSAKEET